MIARYICPFALLLLAAVLTGCGGPQTAEVSGKITRNGKPLQIERMTISFMGADGKPITVLIEPDGSYSVSGVSVGEVQVGFGVAHKSEPRTDVPKDGESAEAFQKRMKDPEEQLRQLRREQRAEKANAAINLLSKYFDPRTSGVATTLNPGPNTFDFDIK